MSTSVSPAAGRGDIDSYRLDLLRRRIVVMAVAIGVVLICIAALNALIVQASSGPRRMMTLSPGIAGAVMIVMALVVMRRRARRLTLGNLLRRSTVIVVTTVLMQIPSSAITAKAISKLMQDAGLERAQIGSLVPLLASMLAVHLVAAIIVPWSLWESARPVLVIVLVSLFASPFSPDPAGATAGGIVAIALMGAPGMLVSWLRHSRLRDRVQMRWLRGRYSEMQRELAFARRLHERLFAKPITDGPVRFDYRYEPMREIGGDFVDVLKEPGGAVTLVLVDVTGHGVAAALAVNRLHGEIKRIVASNDASTEPSSDPARTPAQIIAALNAYVSLTLADESVFATAIAIRLDPIKQRLDWCNAGHPPAFVRRSSGAVEPLDSTAMMLGPLSPVDFDAELGTMSLAIDDLLVAYTDGAIEGRNARDEELGVDGLRSIVSSAGVTTFQDDVWQRIRQHRTGEAEDDVLLLVARLADSVASADLSRVGPRTAHSAT